MLMDNKGNQKVEKCIPSLMLTSFTINIPFFFLFWDCAQWDMCHRHRQCPPPPRPQAHDPFTTSSPVPSPSSWALAPSVFLCPISSSTIPFLEHCPQPASVYFAGEHQGLKGLGIYIHGAQPLTDGWVVWAQLWEPASTISRRPCKIKPKLPSVGVCSIAHLGLAAFSSQSYFPPTLLIFF